MPGVDFFEGQRPLTKIVFILNKGKTTIVCTPWEEWKLIEPCPFTLCCGNSRTEKIIHRLGIERTQSTSFESTIGSSLGEKGIAAIEGSLKSTFGEEVKFQAGIEKEQEFNFDSPKCGYKVVNLYQKVRAVHIKYDDQRFWHRNATELTVFDWLKPIYDGTYAEQQDPRCNCKNMPEQETREGIAARIVCGDALKLAVQWSDNHRLEFPEEPVALNQYFSWGQTIDGQLPAFLLPDYLRFLVGVEAEEFLEAHAFRESVHFVETPTFQGATEVRIELNEVFEPLETISGLHVEAIGEYETLA